MIDVPGRLVVGLENKINAADRERQVVDYVEFVRSRSQGRDWAFVFLTPNGREPSAKSIAPQERDELNKQFFRIAYRREIHGWLQSCMGICRAERVREFLADMSEWAESLIAPAQTEDQI
jgi:hypothetical protein